MTARLLIIILCHASVLSCSKLADFPDKSPEDADLDAPDDGMDAGDLLDGDPDNTDVVDPDATDTVTDGPTDVETDDGPCVDQIPRLDDVRITDSSGYSQVPSIAWTGSEYGVAWHDSRDGSPAIFFARITPEGAKVDTETKISIGIDGYDPSLVWGDNQYGVAWWDDREGTHDIYFVRISGTGLKIGSDTRISFDSALSRYPSLAWSGSEFGVSWEDQRDGNREIYFVRISDVGARIGADLGVTADDDLGSASPSVAWSGSDYGIAWWDGRDGNDEIYFQRVTGGGTLFDPNVRVTDDTGQSRHPSIVWTGSEFGVAWDDTRHTGYEILFKRIAPNGDLRGEDLRLTTDGSYKTGTSLVWANGEFGVSWQGSRDGNNEIYFVLISSTGSLIGTEHRVTNESADSNDPSLVWTGSEFGVAWWDTRDLNDEIYFNIIHLCP